MVAGGLAARKLKRERSSRIAATGCVELQAKAPVVDLHRYSELQRCITQVRLNYHFDVRWGRTVPA